MSMNLWHDVSFGDKAPEEFNAIIEIPKGSFNKYEVDKDTGLIALDRANYTSAPYPFDYGFIPQTLWDDGDPFDVIIMTTFALNAGILVRTRPVALMEMTDDGESDYKIIAVPSKDRRFEEVKGLDDLNNHTLKEFKHFFETYKDLKEKDTKVTVHGYKDKQAAIDAFNRSVELYKQKFGGGQ